MSRRKGNRRGTPRTISVPQAGWEYYGLGEVASYAAAERGDIPYIRIGNLKRVPIAAMEAKLAAVGGLGPVASALGEPSPIAPSGREE
jgi:hypothetical protein